MRQLALWAALPFLLAGCAQSVQNDIHANVKATNGTDHAVTLLVKAWDHNGVQVFNATTELQPGQSATLGTVTGPVPAYGAQYSWFAQTAEIRNQVAKGPEGISTWTIQVNADRIDFGFAA